MFAVLREDYSTYIPTVANTKSYVRVSLMLLKQYLVLLGMVPRKKAKGGKCDAESEV